jgi:uncharacterized RDD family membrane protein YckC
VTVTGHRSYAGLVSRLGGLSVDIVLAALAVAIIGRGIPEAWKLVASTPPTWLDTAFRIAADISPAIYFAACWQITGETLGSWLFGTRVTRSDGGRLGVVRAVLRAVFGMLLAPIWFVGLLTVLFDRRRRSLLDMAFGTVVRYLPRTPTPTSAPWADPPYGGR